MGCSDSEELHFNELKDLWEYNERDPIWETIIWVIIRRREMPQSSVEEYIRDAGIWDLDELKVVHGLRPNRYDGMSKITISANQRYDDYCR